MTITPDHAKALLDGATPGPWHSVYYEDENREIVPDGIVSEMADLDEEGYPIGNISVFRSGPTNREDALLAAAAPALARTVIDQAEKLRNIRVLAEALAARHEREDHGENAHETALFNAILGKKADDK